jgi:hypothetical protein
VRGSNQYVGMGRWDGKVEVGMGARLILSLLDSSLKIELGATFIT